jgi:glycosyltransferase involved in cell wall biosynthesis
MPQTLAIVIPVYNPVAGWQQETIERLQIFISKAVNYRITICLVNDGSTNDLFFTGAQEVIAGLPMVNTEQQNSNCGKGAAVRKGLSAMQADLYLITDVDIPYSLQSMLDLLNSDANIRTGVRNSDYYAKINQERARLSKALRWFVKNLLLLKVNDTQCGLKVLDEVGKELMLQTTTNRYLFDLELLVRQAKQKKITLAGVPVQLRDGITLSTLNSSIYKSELMNFVKIFFLRYF